MESIMQFPASKVETEIIPSRLVKETSTYNDEANGFVLFFISPCFHINSPYRFSDKITEIKQ